MTWQERRIITILSIILAVLSALLLIVLGIRYRLNRDTTDPAIPTQSETAAVEYDYLSLRYYNGTTTHSFSRDEQGNWIWSDDHSFPLDDTVVCGILDLLNNWNPQQTLTDADSISGSGMAQPTASLTATTPTGTVSLLFGRTTTDGTSRYVQLNEDVSTVYIIDDALYQLMCIPVFDMCILPEIPALPEESIHSIVIRGIGTEESPAEISVSLSSQQKKDGSVIWLSDGSNVSQKQSVQDLLSDLSALSFEKCVLYHPSKEAASICGFDNPTKLLIYYTTETDEDAMLTLQIGTPLPDNSGRYVRMGEDPSIYLLPTSALDPLMRLSVNGLE